MKKKFSLLIVSIFMMMSLVSIKAAAYISITTNKNTYNIGETIRITVSESTGVYTYSGDIKVSGAANLNDKIGIFSGSSQTFSVQATKAGTVTINVSGKATHEDNTSDSTTKGNTKTVTVVNPTPPPTGGGGGGGNTKPPTGGGGGGNTRPPSGNTGGNSGGSTVPGNDGTYKPELPIGETEEEKKAREEREAALEREKELKTPLIEKIEVTSNSDKRRDKVISTFTPEFEKFNFEYLVPMNIDSVKLNVVGIDDSVVLTYEDDYDVSDDSVVVVKAVKGDITQEFKLDFKSKAASLVKRDDGVIYADEELDKSMVALGFEISDVEVDGVSSQMFTRGKLNLQLVVDEGNEAEFYRLDEAGEVVDRGQLINEESEVFFVGSSLPEDLVDYTLYGNGVGAVSIEVPEYLSAVDESLLLKNNVRGWTYDEGIVVYAHDDELVSDFFRIKPQSSLKSAVVAFDIEDNTLLYTLYGVSIALVVTIIAFLSYFLVQRKKARRV